MFRWERSTIQSHIRTVVEVPQIYDSVYVARKTWGRLFRPVLTTIHILAWIFALSSGGRVFALLLAAWYVFESHPGYEAFFAQHPYMARYWWAAVGQDFFYIIQDYVCWATLGDTSWETRTVTAEDQNKQD